jgi:hypothetical protein
MKETGSGEQRKVENGRALDSRPPALPREFEFLESPADFRDPAATIVRIPRGVRSKQRLFLIYSTALRFPRYFGWNWDAFEECLNDLSWLRPDQTVVIVHEELPFGAGGENRGIYLDVLRRMASNTAGNRGVRTIMPTSLRGDTQPSSQ